MMGIAKHKESYSRHEANSSLTKRVRHIDTKYEANTQLTRMCARITIDLAVR